jgi:hypothetical protein
MVVLNGGPHRPLCGLLPGDLAIEPHRGCADHLMGVPITKFAQLVEQEGVLRCLLLLRNSLFPFRWEELIPRGNNVGVLGESFGVQTSEKVSLGSALVAQNSDLVPPNSGFHPRNSGLDAPNSGFLPQNSDLVPQNSQLNPQNSAASRR